MRQNSKWTSSYLSTKGQYALPEEKSLPVKLTHCRKWNVRHCLYPFLILRLVEKIDVPGRSNTGDINSIYPTLCGARYSV